MRRENFLEQVSFLANGTYTFKPQTGGTLSEYSTTGSADGDHKLTGKIGPPATAVDAEMWEVAVDNDSNATLTVTVSTKDAAQATTYEAATKAMSATATHEFGSIFSQKDELVVAITSSGGNIATTGCHIRVIAGPEHGGVNGTDYATAEDIT